MSYLIEVPHGEEKFSCIRAMKVFANSGSHFLANAEWGCSDDEHKAWMIVDTDTREEAAHIVPPGYRKDARITRLFRVNKDDLEQFIKNEESGRIGTYHRDS